SFGLLVLFHAPSCCKKGNPKKKEEKKDLKGN
ncbi:unnamed protein product, partial [marine sediment metagenome]